jgi:uncharacterized protein
MALTHCPICRKRFDTTQSTTLPFCSDRCRRIDLGRWLGEEYSVPVDREEDDDPEQLGEEDEP